MSYSDAIRRGLKKRGKDVEITATESGGNDYERAIQRGLEKKEALRQSDFFSTVNRDDDDDIAPVKKKDDDGLDFFQRSSLFDDGWDWGDGIKTILGSVGDAGVNVVKGVGGLVEGVTDLASYGVAYVADAFGNDDYATDLRKKTQESYVDKILKPAEDYLDKYSVLGRTSDSILQGVGQVGGIMATGGLGAAAGLGAGGVTALTTGAMFASGTGSGIGEAYQGGANDLQALKHGLNSGAADAVSELIFGGLGKGINALGFSRGLSSADDILAKLVGSKFKNQIARNVVEFGIKAGAEGLEEVAAGFWQAVSKYNTYLKDKGVEWEDVLKDENLLEQFVVGAFTSGIAQTPGLHIANKNGTDFITGMTQNEQAVVQKEIENRIAEAEKDGKKLSAKEKSAIETQVERDLEKGYIATDTIEEVLGGETYKTYKDTIESEDSLLQELDTLYKMKQSDMTGEQIDRLAQLKPQAEEIRKNNKRDQLKTQLGEEVFNLATGDRLAESYNERSRRGQAFQADVSKYDAKQQVVIQKAIDSGILNNTNRTHEFVDLVAKISADKDVPFDFTNNDKLKTSGFSLEGKTVNGYVTKDGIAVNIQSSKSLNTVVGHEIAHVLEGTEFYTELQKAVVDYAKAKGDFQARYDSLTKLYEGVEGADIDAELTADLVGDYLFTDAEFVNRLSTESRSVFQKVFDEIKYLCRVATAGSKEARQLEQVKRVFEQAYRENVKNTAEDGGVKYALGQQPATGTQYQYAYTKPFADQLVDYQNGNIRSDDTLVVGRTPDVLKKIGLAGLPMTINQKHVGDMLNGTYKGTPQEKLDHSFTAQELATLPEKIADPIAIIYDKRVGKANASESNIDVLVEMKVASGKQVLAAVQINGNGRINGIRIDTNKVATVHGNTDSVTRLVDAINENQKGNVSVFYINNEKTTKVLQRTGNPIPSGLSNLDGFVNSITDLGSPVNMRINSVEESQQFKWWFGDWQNHPESASKVVNADGTPKVMYHGTSKGGHTVFDINMTRHGLFGQGFYFTDSKAVGESYTRKGKGKNPQVYEVYLNIKNPMDMDAEADPAEWAKTFPDVDFPESGTNEQFYRAVEEFYADQWMSRWEVAEEIQAGIESGMGYDGITHIGGGRVNSDGERHRVYIAFQPEQIKSATDNIGTFDGGNPDIRYSLSSDKERIATYGNYNVYGEDVALDLGPVREDVAENATVSKTESVAPYEDNWQDSFDAITDKDAPTSRDDPSDEKKESKPTRKSLHEGIIKNIKAIFSEKGFDFDAVLKKAKNLSTFATVDNTPQRVMEKALGYKEGGILSDITVNKVAQNETEGIKWLNSFLDRKNGLLAQISRQYNIKPGSKQSAAAQMYAEGFYVGENNEIIKYGDAELAKDFPNARVQQNIKGLARDPRIRKIYDETLSAINASRTRNAYPEIPRLDNYFLHFRAMEDTFSRLGLPFNPNDIRAKDLPTDLNGVTADLKPGQPYFASAMHRTGKRTSFDLLGGLEKYLTSAKNQIYHIDDIQNLRALRNYIAETYGQAHGLDNLDELSDAEAEERIKEVYGSHLSTFAKFLNEEANVLAGKTALIDRGLEGIIGRRGITFLDTVNRQVGSNMVGFNISSSLTNFLAPVQALAKTNKADFVKGLAQTAANKIGSIFGRGDGFAETSPVMIRRKGAESFYRTPWQNVADKGYILMGVVDDISTELIARTKYNELTRKGMDAQQAHFETDKWVSRLMGDRSLGQQPQLYNSKMLGLVTKFQLEVRNQLDSQFYDTIQEAKVASEDIENALLRNAKKAAKIGSTFTQLAVLQHIFGKAFEAVAGYNPAFDIIEVIIKTLGWDDDEEDEDTVLDNIEEGFMALLEDMPYFSLMTGGRIPIESALPIAEFVKGEDRYGNEKSRWDTLAEVAPYYLMPGGYGQVKKTKAGMDMFSEDLPIAGSYTNRGGLRFPVEDTTQNRVQAALFGQYANQNARDYFDNDYAPLKGNQLEEFIDSDMSIQEYRKYREGMKDLTKQAEKLSYINGLDLTTAQKDALKSHLFDEEGYKKDNPEKYAFLENEGIGYLGYKQLDEDTQEAWSWAYSHQEEYQFYKENGVMPEDYSVYRVPMLDFDNKSNEAYQWAFDNPEKATFGKVFGDGVQEYRKYVTDLDNIKSKDEYGNKISTSVKDRKIDYINSLDIEWGEKLILFKNEYNADDTYNEEIIEYLNGRMDISFEEEISILRQLGFSVTDDGTITWD